LLGQWPHPCSEAAGENSNRRHSCH
jgi:hypothetical protein